MSSRQFDFRHCPVCAETTLHKSLVCTRNGCGHSLMPHWEPIPKDTRGCFLDRPVAERKKKSGVPGRKPSLDLTARELEISQLIAQGITQANIARKLGLTRAAVSSCVQRACERIGAHKRYELVRYVRSGSAKAGDGNRSERCYGQNA